MAAVEIQALAHYVFKNKSAGPLLFAVQQSGLLSKPTKFYQSLVLSGYKNVEAETIALITAAQDQALRTKANI